MDREESRQQEQPVKSAELTQEVERKQEVNDGIGRWGQTRTEPSEIFMLPQEFH